MENPPESNRTVLVISVWTERLPGGQPAWRGTIRAVDGRRRRFGSLTELNRLLHELSGWQEASSSITVDPPSARSGGNGSGLR
jgi:hypothetical protein